MTKQWVVMTKQFNVIQGNLQGGLIRVVYFKDND